MHFSTIAFSLFGAAASTSAFTLVPRQSLPDCAVQCTMNADFGGCAPTDNHCLCTTPAFVDGTTACVEATCTGADLTNALSFSQELCAKVGVTLTPASTTAASSTSASGASTTSASATSTAPASTLTGSGTSTGAPAVTSTSSGAASRQVGGLFALAAAGMVVLAL